MALRASHRRFETTFRTARDILHRFDIYLINWRAPFQTIRSVSMMKE
jgi:hypothetical protein